MKNSIIAITIALVVCLTSCKEDYSALIQKIEATQAKLQQQDSALTFQRNELAMLVYTDTTKISGAVNPKDSLFTILVSQQNTLITRLEIIMQKNKELITKLNDNSANPAEVEKEYTAHADELELMKPEVDSAKESYNKLVKTVDDAFENLGDTTIGK